MVSAEDAPKGL